MASKVILSSHERRCLHKFFSAVNRALSSRLSEGFNPNEEHLTSVLCEMLDSRQTVLYRLDYTWEDLANDLRQSTPINDIRLELKLNEHSRHFEGRYSYADLGIVVRWEDGFGGQSVKKAVLAQAKRLFRQGADYTCDSRYESFDMEQFAKFTGLSSASGMHDCMKYLLYNPLREAFSAKSQSELAYLREIRTRSARRYYQLAECDNILSLWRSPSELLSPESDVGMTFSATEWMWRRYMTRQDNEDHNTGVECTRSSDPVEMFIPQPRFLTHKPTFREFFSQFDLCREWASVTPFADFLVFDLICGDAGCEDERILDIAEGRPPEDDGDDAPPSARWATRYSLLIDVTTHGRRLEDHAGQAQIGE